MTRITSLWRAISDEAARDWRVSPRLAAWVFLLPFAGALVVILSRVDKGAFKLLTGEDRLLEWLQFLGYLAGAVFALLAARRLFRRAGKGWGVTYLLFGLGCLLVAGEEIDWGQHIFGFQTGLEELNEQGETTIHNIGPVQDVFNVVLLLAGLYGTALPWLARRRGGFGRSTRLFVPPLFLSSCFFLLFAYKLVRYVALPEDRFTLVEFGEWPEFGFALALAAFAGLNYLWLRSPETVTAAASPRPVSSPKATA